MKTIQELFNKINDDQSLIHLTFSNIRNKNAVLYNQVKVKPVRIKKELYYQFEYIFKTKVTHENIAADKFVDKAMEIAQEMKQINIYSSAEDYQILISKKLKAKIIKTTPTKVKDESLLNHNRKK